VPERTAPPPPLATPSSAAWRPLGAVAPTALAEARVQLHHAAQVANAAALTLLPREPDDSHTSFTWDATLGALVARPLATTPPLRVALRVADLTLLALAGDAPAGDAPAAAYPLDGRSQAEALAWVQARVGDAGADGARVTMRRHFEIPGAAPDAAHPWRLGDGAGAAFRELAAWYADAALLLGAVAAREPGAGPVTCWPHHFDIATLIEEPRDDAGTRRTIGVGLSPGDDSYAEPYFYIGPYPHPEARGLPSLPLGRWHTSGWFGAALPGSELVAAGDAAAQERRARDFVDAALAAVRALRVHAGAGPRQ
jgi:hypothetical protein